MEISTYKTLFLEHLKKNVKTKDPVNLYEPISYILNLGGKRLRPVLTLMSCELFGGDVSKALDAAVTIEMFHNFSLIHDDIMDAAPLRRGQKSVHERWGINTGILSGDALLVLAYESLDSYEAEYKELNTLFNKTALEVCEGQQFDFDFESRNDVSVKEYIKMITLKTAVLIATSLKFGAIIASADGNDTKEIYDFGLNLGIAFQLQDDYLDVFAKEDFGKQKAGDIIENKKTFLFLKLLELANETDKTELLKLYSTKNYSESKIISVISLYRKYDVPKFVKEEVKKYTSHAVQNIHDLSLSIEKKKILENFANQLMQRKI